MLEREEGARVSYKLDSKTIEKIRETAESESYSRRGRGVDTDSSTFSMEVSVHGDYNKTLTSTISTETEVAFDGIPVGSNIYVEASIYTQTDGEKEYFYKGRSKNFTVRAGENQVVFVLKRVNRDGSSQGEGDNGGGSGTGGGGSGGGGGTGGGGSGGGGNEPDPVLTIDFYVSATNASDLNGDGSQEHPFASIQRAVSEINSENNNSKDWVIGIDGMLRDVQTLEKVFNGETFLEIPARSITLTGLTGSSTDGIDAGWDGVSEPAGNIGSALTIETAVPVTLRKLTIKGGDAQNGGGLYLKEMYDNTACSVTMINSNITGNAAVKDGGGVYIEKGRLTMKSGEISGNKTVYVAGLSDSSSGNGGGVLLYQSGAIFDMQGGSVSSNNAANYAGAVYIASRGIYGAGSFIMSGGTISENDCDYSYSKAVYVPGQDNKNGSRTVGYFEMSGSAVITSDNDVYLGVAASMGTNMGTDAVITISGPLTGETPVATISGDEGDPELHHAYLNQRVLAATGSGSVAQSYKKFAVKPYNNTTPYYIDSNGCLTTTQPRSIDLYIKDGASGEGTSLSSPFGSISDAVAYIQSHGDSGTTVTIKISGNLSGAQRLEDIDNTKANMIIIEGANGTDLNGVPKDALTGGSGVETTLSINVTASTYNEHLPVTIQNLRISGAAEHGLFVGDGNGTNWNEVYLDSGVLITENGSGSGDYDGAGVYIDDNAAVVVNAGCTISNNAAGRNGGGIYALGFLDLEAGTITGNTAQKGKGIYAAAPGISGNNGVRLFENASVASNNDIYLCSGETILIAAPLINSSVATITPEEYTIVQLLEKQVPFGSQDNINMADMSQKFAVTQPSGSSVTWSINTRGMLISEGFGNNVVTIHVATRDNNGNDELNNGTIYFPYETIGKAIYQMTDEDTDYIVYVHGDYSSSSEWKIEDIRGARSITIQGKAGTTGNKLPGVYTESKAPITFKNIQIGAMYIGAVQVDEDSYEHADVILDTGTLIQNNSSITSIDGNELYGVVHLYQKGAVTLTMKSGAVISNNTYVNTDAVNNGYGACGGVYIGQYSKFIMEGGTISGNAEYDVSNCKDGYFIVSGDAQAGKVYCKALDSADSRSAPIYIGGPLTSTTVATITPYFYTNWQALELANDENDNPITTTTIGAECGKFAVTPTTKIVGSQIVDVNYIVNEYGTLQEVSSGGGGTSGIVVTSNAGGSGIATMLSSDAPVNITISNDDETIDFTKLKIKVGSTEYVSDSLRNFVTTGSTDNENSYEFSFDSSLTDTGTEIIIYYDENEIKRLSVMRRDNLG